MGIRIRPATTLIVLLTIVLGLQIVAIISVPVTKSIALCTYDGYKFGVFGLCKGDECTAISIGYTSKDLSESLAGFSLPSNARKSVSKLLIVHVISAGFTFVMFLNSLILHWSGASKSLRFLLFNLLLSIPTFLLSLLSFLVDILLFVPHLDWGGWIVLAATVLISVCSVLLCIMRRTASSRHGHTKSYGKSNIGESGEYQMAPLNFDYGTVDGGSFVKPLDSQENDEADDTFDGVGFHSRYADISHIPQTTRQDHVRDGSVVSSSYNGYMSRTSPYTFETTNINNTDNTGGEDEKEFQIADGFSDNILPDNQTTTYPAQNSNNFQNSNVHEPPQYHNAPVPLLRSSTTTTTATENAVTPYPTSDPVPEFGTFMTAQHELNTKASLPYPITVQISDPNNLTLDDGFVTQSSSPGSSPTESQPPSSPSKLLGPRPYRGSTTSLQNLMPEESSTVTGNEQGLGTEPGLSKEDVTVTRNPTFRTQIENSLNALQPKENILEATEGEEEGLIEEDPIDFVNRKSQGKLKFGRSIGVLEEDDLESSVFMNHSDLSEDSIVVDSEKTSFKIPSETSSFYPNSQTNIMSSSRISGSSIHKSSTNQCQTPQNGYFQTPNLPGANQFNLTPTPPHLQTAQSSVQHINQRQNHLVSEITSYHIPQNHRPTNEDLQDFSEYKSSDNSTGNSENNLPLPSPDDLRSTPPPSFSGQSFASSHYTSVSQRGINPEYMKLHPEEFGLIRMQENQQQQYLQQEELRMMPLQVQVRNQNPNQNASHFNELRPHGNMGKFDIKKTGLLIPPKLGNRQNGSTNSAAVIDFNPDFSVAGRKAKNTGNRKK